jgi:hypothetical protein
MPKVLSLQLHDKDSVLYIIENAQAPPGVRTRLTDPGAGGMVEPMMKETL